MLSQKINRSQRFQSGDIPSARHHDIRLAALVRTGPGPNAYTSRAVSNRSIHIEPLQLRLLAGDNYVYVVPTAQTVIGHRKQRVGVRRQVDAYNVGFLVHHEIDEAGVLVSEAVVILPPDVRSQKVIQRGNGASPRNVTGGL